MSMYDGTDNDINIAGYKVSDTALKILLLLTLKVLKQQQKEKQKKMKGKPPLL